ncbi:MAG: hypothetical protein L6R45_23070 [Anaerolineae bacterium]|nr:hypothetical protein [Anaerolineae bacterium]
MKVLEVELPEKIVTEVEQMIKDGWFVNETEVIHLALIEFIRHHRLTLMEQFQREDIAWALQQKEAKQK